MYSATVGKGTEEKQRGRNRQVQHVGRAEGPGPAIAAPYTGRDQKKLLPSNPRSLPA